MKQVAALVVDTVKLDRLTAEVRPRAAKLINETATEVELQTKINIRTMYPGKPSGGVYLVDIGTMRDSIHTEKVGDMTYIVSDGVDYGIHHELGAPEANIPARPFLTPAVEKVRKGFFERWKELFKV